MSKYPLFKHELMPPKIDWKKVYETLPGKMKNCLGAACPQACCREKNIETHPYGLRPYFTTLCETEKPYLERTAFPTLEMLRIKVRKETVVFQTPDQTIFDDINLVGNCKGPNGKCKFEEFVENPGPPLACRTQPFSHNAKRPIMAPECPRIAEIAEEDGVIKGILEVRKLLGFTDNNTWQENLRREIERIMSTSAPQSCSSCS